MVQEARRMQGYGSDFIKEMFAAAKNPDMISFACLLYTSDAADE